MPNRREELQKIFSEHTVTDRSLLTTTSADYDTYLKNGHDPEYFKNILMNPENLLTLINGGGFFNGGVCWWHSRFQRNAAYLTAFKKDEPKPSKRDAQKIIRRIKRGRSVSIIPGYANLNEFSREYESYIQKQLNLWQFTDSLLFQWIRGLTGKVASKLKPSDYEKTMKEISDYVIDGKKIAYVMTQIPKIDTHCWLIPKVEKIEKGYRFYAIDSFKPTEIMMFTYIHGNEYYFKDGMFGHQESLYLQFRSKPERCLKTAKKFLEKVK